MILFLCANATAGETNIHQLHWFTKKYKPQNIVWNLHNLIVFLIDFLHTLKNVTSDPELQLLILLILELKWQHVFIHSSYDYETL